MIVLEIFLFLGASFLLYLGLQGFRTGRMSHGIGDVETGRRAMFDSILYTGLGAAVFVVLVIVLLGGISVP